jgi:hypothetical protein
MKIDPWHHEKKYKNWKKKGILTGISKFNAQLIKEYIIDMENGYNVTRPGGRSYSRLNNLRQRMRWMAMQMEVHFKKERVVDLTRREASMFFNDYMRKGKIKTKLGQNYTSVADYANVFKAFWHWYQKREAENDSIIHDITTFIDMSPVKERNFVYFTIEELKQLTNRAKYNYRILMWFMFDSGIRAPTELMNVRINDLTWLDSDIYELHIREEVSKTFGRRPKLLLCSQMLKEYIETEGLEGDQPLFPINPTVVKRYIQRLAERVWGDKITKGGKYAKEIRLYDFRHSSACYWLPRYKSESAFKFRFGWKENKMIHYYTKLLGMTDTIEEKDILLDSEARTKLERELEQLKNDALLRQEKHSQEMDELRKMLRGQTFKETIQESVREELRKEIMQEFTFAQEESEPYLLSSPKQTIFPEK